MDLLRFNRDTGELEFASAGDVHAQLYHLRDTSLRLKIRMERVAVEPNSVLVIFTDGLKSKTMLKGELEILRRPAIGIAQYPLETHSRPDDDALVCAIKTGRQ